MLVNGKTAKSGMLVNGVPLEKWLEKDLVPAPPVLVSKIDFYDSDFGLLNMITMIDPWETPFCSAATKVRTKHVYHEWVTDTLVT